MRRTTGAVAGLLLTGALAACGSSSDPTDSTARDGTSSASASGTPASSTPAASDSASPAAESGTALFAAMRTAISEAKTATVRFSSSVGAQRVSGAGVFRYGRRATGADVVVTVAGQGRLRAVLLLPKGLYLRLPPGAGLPPGKRWLAISAGGGGGGQLAKVFAPLADSLRQSFDPEESLGIIQAATTVRASGHARVDGVDTRRYVARVDLAKAARSAKGRLAQQYRALVASGVTTLGYVVWVDAKDLPRKLVTTVRTPQGEVTSTATYRGWGKPVTIKAPPKSAVASATQLGAA